MHTAALITGPHQLELLEFDDPLPVEGTAVVEISYCGICGTDVHAYSSGEPYPPAICGHEWTGTVSAVGGGVERLAEGDRVVVAVPPACGRCDACRAGHTDHCVESFMVSLGRDALAPPHGGFASRIAVTANRLVIADPGLTDEQAALVEPATVTFHAVRRSGLRLGDTAVVQGAGPIGLLTLQWVRAAGAGDVVVIEPRAGRQDLARQLGASVVVGPDEAAPTVQDRTGGLGADIVFECVGRSGTVQSAVDLARRGGAMSLIGLATGSASIKPGAWLVKEISVTSSLAYLYEEFELAMAMIASGRIDVEALHTGTTDLAGLADTMAALAGEANDDTKVLVKPVS